MAADMNRDGKEVYYDNQVKKIQVTDTLRNPTQDQTNVFDGCKIQNKAYRANSESQTIYKEKTREKKSLINFQAAPFDPITLRDEAAKLTMRRPMTTLTAG